HHRGELRQQPVERGTAQRGERAVIPRDLDVHPVDVHLEVHGPGGVPRLTDELPALDVEPDEEPADDADERADHTGQETVDVHDAPSLSTRPPRGNRSPASWYASCSRFVSRCGNARPT